MHRNQACDNKCARGMAPAEMANSKWQSESSVTQQAMAWRRQLVIDNQSNSMK